MRLRYCVFGSALVGLLGMAGNPALALDAYGTAVQAYNPTHYWRLDETSGTTAYDIGSSAVNGTYLGTLSQDQASLVPSSTNGSLGNSNGGYVSVGNLGNITSSGTIEFWTTTSGIPTAGYYPNTFTTGGLGGAEGNNAIRFELRSDGRYDATYGNSADNPTSKQYFVGTEAGGTQMGVNTPYHVAFTWTGNGSGGYNIAGYLNGVQKFTASNVTTLPTSFSDVNISAGWSPERKWSGGVDEVAMYNSALSVTQVATQYNASGASYATVINALNPLAYWTFNDTSSAQGGTVKNSSAAGVTYDGTYGANVTQVASVKTTMGTALHFEGNGSLNVPNVDFPTGNSDRTVNLWLRTSTPAANGIYRGLFEYGQNGTDGKGMNRTFEGSLWNPDDPNSAYGSVGVSQWGDGVGSTGAVNDGTWHMYTIVVDSSQVSEGKTLWKIYVDGKYNNAKYMATNTELNSLGMIIGACYDNANGWIGDVDEVAVFKGMLSDAQIQGFYATAVPEPGMMVLCITGLIGLFCYAWKKRK